MSDPAEVKDYVLRCVARWLDVRARHLRNPAIGADVSHSALLGRLLEGKEPLDAPPPKSYSYPWYELVEEGKAYISECWRLDERTLVIHQSIWNIVSELGPNEWLVTYSFTQYGVSSWHTTRWRVLCRPIAGTLTLTGIITRES